MSIIGFGCIEFGENETVKIEYSRYLNSLLNGHKISAPVYSSDSILKLKVVFLGLELLALKHSISEDLAWFLLYNTAEGFPAFHINHCKQLGRHTLNGFMSTILKKEQDGLRQQGISLYPT